MVISCACDISILIFRMHLFHMMLMIVIIIIVISLTLTDFFLDWLLNLLIVLLIIIIIAIITHITIRFIFKISESRTKSTTTLEIQLWCMCHAKYTIRLHRRHIWIIGVLLTVYLLCLLLARTKIFTMIMLLWYFKAAWSCVYHFILGLR